MPWQDFRSRWLGKSPEPKAFVATGAAANTNITVTGIKAGDHIVGVFSINNATAWLDLTSTVTITAANTIRSTAVTTGERLMVFYWTI